MEIVSKQKSLILFIGLLFIINFSFGQCSAGMLVPETIFVPLGEDFEVTVSDVEIPDGHYLAWAFDSSETDGYGGTVGNGGFYQLGSPDLTSTFNNDLNGNLSLFFGAPLEGEWKLTTKIIDENNEPCDESENFVIIDFEKFLCFAGNVSTVGEITVCHNETFDLSVSDRFNHPFGYSGWYFDNQHTNGTGGLFGAPTVIAAGDLDVSYDHSINGFLNGFGDNTSPFEGTWVVKAVQVSYDYYSEFGESQFCSISEDSLIVTFNSEISVGLSNADNLVVIASPSGGTPPYTYNWSNGDTEEATFNLANGDLTVTVTDDLGCTSESTITLDDITSVNTIRDLDFVSVFPNPATNLVNLDVRFNDYCEWNYRLVDIHGRSIVESDKIKSRGGKYPIDISELNSGIYILNIYNSQGYKSLKVIKSK